MSDPREWNTEIYTRVSIAKCLDVKTNSLLYTGLLWLTLLLICLRTHIGRGKDARKRFLNFCEVYAQHQKHWINASLVLCPVCAVQPVQEEKDECWAFECKSTLSARRKDCFGSPGKSPGKRIHVLQCNLCIPHEMPLTKYTWSYQSPVSADRNTKQAPISLKKSVLFQNTNLMHEVTHLFSTCSECTVLIPITCKNEIRFSKMLDLIAQL